MTQTRRFPLHVTVWALTVLSGLLPGCVGGPDYEHSVVVTASAYNSLHGQTAGDPTIGAWGDQLQPGMKAIAVSRDLEALGLTHGVEVKIDGFEGTFQVLDRMNARFTKRIDIYMGEDVDAARNWGRQKVTIHWNSPDE